MSRFEYTFPSISGVQAGREYYVSMCPLKLIPKIFLFDDDELSPELRAQRTLNRSRIPEMTRYIIENKSDYIFSAITASIDGRTFFEAVGGNDGGERLGLLRVDMNAKFIINDGQHRRAAIEMALRDEPGIGDETIAVVFFLDRGLSRSQQMFADLNRYAVRPAKSLGLLYDHRNETAKIGKLTALKCPSLKGLVEFERTSLSERSRKLFTLSSLSSATEELLASAEFKNVDEAVEQASAFWTALFERIPEWHLVRSSKMTSGEIRKDFVHSHGVLLQAFGKVGSAIRLNSKGLPNFKILDKLGSLDFQRSNVRDWEGRVMIGGRMSKASNSVVLASSLIKSHLGIEPTPEENKAEVAFSSARSPARKVPK
jgi:DNA sulfur modification protein DndB